MMVVVVVAVVDAVVVVAILNQKSHDTDTLSNFASNRQRALEIYGFHLCRDQGGGY